VAHPSEYGCINCSSAGSAMLCMDQPTSLVVAGCLCVIAAASVILVILRTCQTFSAAKTPTYLRLPTVAVASRQSTDVWNRLAGNSSSASSSSPLMNSAAERSVDGDDDDTKSVVMPPALEGNARQRSDTGVDE